MKRDTQNKTITFQNDNEFIDFAVVQELVCERSESGILVTTWNFTNSYDKSVEEGYKFYISDPASQITKHQCVAYRTICRPVEVHSVRPSSRK